MSNLTSDFLQVKFGLTAPQGGEMFDCLSKAEIPMMAFGHLFDQTELLANGNSLILWTNGYQSMKGVCGCGSPTISL